MTNINIIPMPLWMRSIRRTLWPLPPPVFPDGAPSPEDQLLARELFRALDHESKQWYQRGGSKLFAGLEAD